MQTRPEITLRICDGGIEKKIPLSDILQQFKMFPVPTSVSLEVKHNNMKLIASTAADEIEFPGINLDAKDKNGNDIYLANAELPNETFPDSITTRMYAGYAAFETDSPIAITTTSLKDQSEVDRLEKKIQTNTGFTKYIHIDRDLAQSASWKSNDNLKEHVEEL